MNIRTLKVDQLSSAEIAAWLAIQQANPSFSSPYFRPEFTQHVASVRDDVEVAVLEEAGKPVGFLPFQRAMFNAGQPIGSGVNDYQGLIASPEIECDPRELLRACRLSYLWFDHMVPVHRSFDRFTWLTEESPYIDLSAGFDNYLSARDNASGLMHEYRRKRRRIEREAGPLRFESHITDPAMLEVCIQWKIAQYQRQGILNIFQHGWISKLLHKILNCHEHDFAGEMFASYAGDQIAAINFGMRSGDLFHSWFPTYNPNLAACSPGFLLWIESMKAAASLGINRIVLGKGGESYKSRLMNGADSVSQGCVDLHPAVASVRRACRRIRQSVKSSPLRAPARVPARLVNRIRHWLAFR